MSAALAVLLLGAATVAAAVHIGAKRWERASRRQLAGLRSGIRRISGSDPGPANHVADEAGLPSVVARYFGAALPDDPSRIHAASFRQSGRFLMRPPEGWRPFTATHEVVCEPPGFLWDADIGLAPGVSVRVRDSLIGTTGSMKASVLGLVPLLDLGDEAQLAVGAMQRYLAEAVWYPTALLPRAGVRWDATGETSARAALESGAIHATLEFSFDPRGLISEVYSPDRPRYAQGAFRPTPWFGRFWQYEWQSGFRIPRRAEVAWIVDGQPEAYWTGEVRVRRFVLTGEEGGEVARS